MEIKLLTERESEFDRFKRLGSLLGYIVDEFKAKGFKFIIESLEDHKGDLYVVWSEQPNDEMKRIVSKGWDNEGELEMNVHHELKG